MSHPGYLHGPLQMLGPENEVCNYLALEKINDNLGFALFRPLPLGYAPEYYRKEIIYSQQNLALLKLLVFWIPSIQFRNSEQLLTKYKAELHDIRVVIIIIWQLPKQLDLPLVITLFLSF